MSAAMDNFKESSERGIHGRDARVGSPSRNDDASVSAPLERVSSAASPSPSKDLGDKDTPMSSSSWSSGGDDVEGQTEQGEIASPLPNGMELRDDRDHGGHLVHLERRAWRGTLGDWPWQDGIGPYGRHILDAKVLPINWRWAGAGKVRGGGGGGLDAYNSRVDRLELGWLLDLALIREIYGFPDDILVGRPSPWKSSILPSQPSVSKMIRGFTLIHWEHLKMGVRFPLESFFKQCIMYCNLVPGQLSPNGWRVFLGFLVLWRWYSLGEPTYHEQGVVGIDITDDNGGKSITYNPTNVKQWKDWWVVMGGNWHGSRANYGWDGHPIPQDFSIPYISKKRGVASPQHARNIYYILIEVAVLDCHHEPVTSLPILREVGKLRVQQRRVHAQWAIGTKLKGKEITGLAIIEILDLDSKVPDPTAVQELVASGNSPSPVIVPGLEQPGS